VLETSASCLMRARFRSGSSHYRCANASRDRRPPWIASYPSRCLDEAQRPLGFVQIDYTKFDVIVVDEEQSFPIGAAVRLRVPPASRPAAFAKRVRTRQFAISWRTISAGSSWAKLPGSPYIARTRRLMTRALTTSATTFSREKVSAARFSSCRIHELCITYERIISIIRILGSSYRGDGTPDQWPVYSASVCVVRGEPCIERDKNVRSGATLGHNEGKLASEIEVGNTPPSRSVRLRTHFSATRSLKNVMPMPSSTHRAGARRSRVRGAHRVRRIARPNVLQESRAHRILDPGLRAQ